MMHLRQRARHPKLSDNRVFQSLERILALCLPPIWVSNSKSPLLSGSPSFLVPPVLESEPQRVTTINRRQATMCNLHNQIGSENLNDGDNVRTRASERCDKMEMKQTERRQSDEHHTEPSAAKRDLKTCAMRNLRRLREYCVLDLQQQAGTGTGASRLTCDGFTASAPPTTSRLHARCPSNGKAVR